MQAYSKKREVSAQECVTRACGINMKKCSHSVVFIPTDDNAIRMSRPLSYLENTAPESENVWMTSVGTTCGPQFTTCFKTPRNLSPGGSHPKCEAPPMDSVYQN